MSSERDEFWNIEKLIPKRKNTIQTFSTKEKTVDFYIPAETDKKSDGQSTLTLQKSDASENITYELRGGLLRSVKIKRFVDKYDFYGSFRKAAEVYYDFKTPKCEFVPFYSYMPQYSQFNSQQKNYYFYWRDSVRRKKYIKTDYSYFYLYIYEILNLPDKTKPEEGLGLLISLWKAYRKDLPNIDKNMSLWVQDFCLIYNLSCPIEKISDFIFDVVAVSEFKEFYLSDIRSMGESGVDAMIAYLSDYDWRSGKYAGGDNREVYSKHLIRAMSMLINEIWQSGEIAASSQSTAHITRTAFRNSLCTHSVKCSLDIEYFPISKSENIRQAVTAALKYTENKLRALLGVKSRLAVKDLPNGYKAVIDSYFNYIFEKANRERLKAAMPEYEKLYDAESSGLSLEGALEIEKSSWSTTVRLVTSEEGDTPLPTADTFRSEEKTNLESDDTDSFGLSASEIDFVSAVLTESMAKIKGISENIGVPIDTISEKINEAFADNFGDIIIEGSFPEIHIIEDYKEDTEEWLLKLTK